MEKLGWGVEIYFLALEPAILPAPTFLLAREQWGIPRQAFLGQQVLRAGAGWMDTSPTSSQPEAL